MSDPCLSDTDTVALRMEGQVLAADVLTAPVENNGLQIRPGQGLWARGIGAGAVLPAAGSEQDGDLFLLQPVDGISWMMRYDSDSVIAQKWQFIGGAAILSVQEASTTYVTDPSPSGAWGNGNAVSGPDILVPYTGRYRVEAEAQVDSDNITGTGNEVSFGVAIGTTADPALSMRASQSNPRPVRIYLSNEIALNAGQTLRMRYLNTFPSNNAVFIRRRMWLTPVRL